MRVLLSLLKQSPFSSTRSESTLGSKRKNMLELIQWYRENRTLYGPLLKMNKSKKITLSRNNDSHVATLQHRYFTTQFVPGTDSRNESSSDVASGDCSSETPVDSSTILKDLELIKSLPLLKPNDDDDLERFARLTDTVVGRLPYSPSVSRILNSTQSRENRMVLERWKAKMIAELGEEGFKSYQEDMLRRGTNVHACIQSFLSGVEVGDVGLHSDNKGYWDSIQPMLGAVSDVQMLETRINHPILNYIGMFDCVATYRDSVCLIDWKTSQKPKPHLSSTYDNPLQVAAYLGALNYDPNYDIKVKNAAIVVAYRDGFRANVHHMDEALCQKYWVQWLQRLHKYWLHQLAEVPD